MRREGEETGQCLRLRQSEFSSIHHQQLRHFIDTHKKYHSLSMKLAIA